MSCMRKILVVRNDRFGEFLLNIPVFRAVKETYPSSELHAAVAPGVSEIARAVPFIDKFQVWPAGDPSWRGKMNLMLRVRQEHFDAALVLNPSSFAHQVVFAAGIPVRIGYARKHAFLLTKTCPDNKGLGLRHEVDNNLELAALLGCRIQDKSLCLNLPPEVKTGILPRFGLDAARPIVAVHPWTSDPVKQWPLDRFELLARRIAEGGMQCVIIGRPESWHGKLDVASAQGVLDLRGKTTLLEAAALLARCTVLVSCDSGPVHLAACVGTPVIALFRNDMPGKNPERWGPWPLGGDHPKAHVVIQKASLTEIDVEAVMAQVFGKVSCGVTGSNRCY